MDLEDVATGENARDMGLKVLIYERASGASIKLDARVLGEFVFRD
jgi:hypothetical protein